MNENPTYAMEELVRRSDEIFQNPDHSITPRKVRYYIAENLLPNPLGDRKNAYYTEDHLLRLHLIRRLRELGVSIHDIRERYRTKSLPSQEVKRILEELDHRERDNANRPALNPAREYILNLMSPKQAAPVLREDAGPPPSRTQPDPDLPAYIDHRSSRAFAAVDQAALFSMSDSLESRSHGWRRLPLLPGVELHYHPPLHPDVERWVSETLDSADDFRRSISPSSHSPSRKENAP